MSARPDRRVIGILGGMGPEATVLLMQRIIEGTPVVDDQDHVPMLVDNNPQVPSRVKAIIEGTGEDPRLVLVAMARGLEAAGAAALAMPCNTAHHYAAAIASAVRIPFLNMVELSAERLVALGARRVGVLASPAVAMTGVFDGALAGRGLETVYPANQDALLVALRQVKVSSRDPAPRAALAAAARELKGAGADVLLVACSEFSIIADAAEVGLPVVDTVDVLADAAVAFSCAPVPADGA